MDEADARHSHPSPYRGCQAPRLPRDTPEHSQHPLSLSFPGSCCALASCHGILVDFAAHTHLEEGIKLALVAHKMGQVANEAVPLLIGCFIVCVIWIDT